MATDEGESDSQFQEELPDVLNEPCLKFPLAGVEGERQEIKIIGVPEELLSKIGLWFRQCALEIGQSLPLPPIEV